MSLEISDVAYLELRVYSGGNHGVQAHGKPWKSIRTMNCGILCIGIKPGVYISQKKDGGLICSGRTRQLCTLRATLLNCIEHVCR